MCVIIVFGMGIDKFDVCFVVYIDLFKLMEGYYQEIGCVGCDGELVEVWFCYGLGDVVLFKQMIEQFEVGEEWKIFECVKFDYLFGYCEFMQCCCQVLLVGFGEIYLQFCGNCDNCLVFFDVWDVSVVVQKVLSCVYCSGQCFGVGYLIDILCGGENEKICQFGYIELSIYGIGKDLDVCIWCSVFCQLVVVSLFEVDSDVYGGLCFIDVSCDVFKGWCKVMMCCESFVVGCECDCSGQCIGLFVLLQDLVLFNVLCGLCVELVWEQNVLVFVIFYDSIFCNIVEQWFISVDVFVWVGGIGGIKLLCYGVWLVEIVCEEG